MHKAHFNNETFSWSKAEPGGTPDCVYFHVLSFIPLLCGAGELHPAHAQTCTRTRVKVTA